MGMIFRVNFIRQLWALVLASFILAPFTATALGRQYGTFPKPNQSARVYLNPNTGRFWTMDTNEGNHEDPLSLHKYLYGQGDPVDGRDPSGNAAYFVERDFDSWEWPAWCLNYGHGYLLFTSPSDTGTIDPIWKNRAQVIDSFSWHPNVWDFDHSARPGVPGRVWEMHPKDKHPGNLHNAILVTTDPGQQSILQNYIKNWYAAAHTGYDYGDPIKDQTDTKNKIGSPHIPAPQNGVYYSVREQNCVWWATIMLKQSNIKVDPGVYSQISRYEQGVGAASQVISGARSPDDVRTLNARPPYMYGHFTMPVDLSAFGLAF
jgi:hypothetical protein